MMSWRYIEKLTKTRFAYGSWDLETVDRTNAEALIISEKL